MSLPLTSPLLPQLARPRKALPEGDGWAFEPKFDGFRAIAFVDGADVELQSRNGKGLTRYFPEVAASFPDARLVLDGEIVASSFDTLGQRIHPAKSRVERLAAETPARFIAFDVLAIGDDVLLERSYDERRAALEGIDGIELAPVVRSTADAERLAARRGGRDRQGDRGALPAGRAHGHGEDQARAHDRRRGHGLAAGQGREHRRRADPRAAHARRQAARDRALQRLHPEGEARARRLPEALRDRRARQRRAVALERRAATSSGSRCARSSSWRSRSTTPPTDASATARRCSAGATTSRRPSARSISSTPRRYVFVVPTGTVL